MSGSLGFIRSNPALAGYDAMSARIAQGRQRDQAQATDAAIRAGIMDMTAGSRPEPAAPEPAPAAPAPAAGPGLASVRASGGAPAASSDEGFTAYRNPAFPAPTYRDPSAVQARDALLDAPPEVLAADSARRTAAVGQPLYNPATVRADAPMPNWDAGLPPPSGRINQDVGGGTPGAAPPQPQPAQPARDPRNPYAPILARLAGTPGGGATALGLLQRGETDNRLRDIASTRAAGQATAAQTRSRQATERNILMAIGRGEVDLARQFAAQIGMELPANITGADEQSRRRFAAGSLLAQRHYGGDPQQAQSFLTTYLQTGNALAALQAAGTPRGAGANWRPMWIQRDEQEVLAFFNPRTRQIEVAGQPAAPGAPTSGGDNPQTAAQPSQPPAGPVTRSPPRSGSQARPAAMETRRQMLVAAGVPPQEAALIASGYQVTPAQRTRAFQAFRTAAERDVLESDPVRREAEIRRRVDAAMAALDEEIGNGRQPAASGAQPPPPQAPVDGRGAAPPPPLRRPPTVPPGSQWSPSRRQFRAPDGRIFNEDGSPAA
ncbi:hypothetical protein [Falsiroseomonas tokyonensis]|uniref:Uncharacterized protein n=1 Tax=Falsiroseomonas tokyonensis TaxID=430521 RepID=A0ABV7BY20_9PROT|nr:hypothetical protein [Falsiroseomonas tokyonensis]MBU8540174.1 hypothetical protein [Falsiroseomonas tokyonensis]